MTADGDALDEYRSLWLKYVQGFDAAKYGQACLLGPISRRIGKNLPLGQVILLDEAEPFDYLYLCGISEGFRPWRPWSYDHNLDLAFKHEPGERFTTRTYRGALVEVENARRLEISEVPTGLRPRFLSTQLRCSNFQFGLSVYGLPDAPMSGFQATGRHRQQRDDWISSLRTPYGGNGIAALARLLYS